ncbi:MAG: terminase TerL endonuclease subunit [Clostridium sp.]|uniref:terminase TerL endonuclease subunit n=1 Tax=Clostridium sp. TaxID=1506 RepID=UPI003F2AC5B6
MSDNSNMLSMASGQRSVLNPLQFVTTTAYANSTSIMHSELDYIGKVLNGVVEDESVLALVYRADYEHLWDDIGILQANPLVIEENFELIREDRKKALLVPEVREEYMTKSMNYFVDSCAGDNYVNAEDVKKCSVPKSEFDWKGKDVKLGLDLAMSGDNVAVGMSHYDLDTDTFTAMSVGFIPVLKLDEKIKKERCDYRRHIEDGNCIACGTKVISYKTVCSFILSLEEEYGVTVTELGYDKWNVNEIKETLEEAGIMMTEIPQIAKHTYPSAKKIREEIETHKFRFIENKLLEENFANARIFPDTNMGYYVNKKKSEGKVDMVISLINSIALWLLEINDGTSKLYENKEMLVL